MLVSTKQALKPRLIVIPILQCLSACRPLPPTVVGSSYNALFHMSLVLSLLCSLCLDPFLSLRCHFPHTAPSLAFSPHPVRVSLSGQPAKPSASGAPTRGWPQFKSPSRTPPRRSRMSNGGLKLARSWKKRKKNLSRRDYPQMEDEYDKTTFI